MQNIPDRLEVEYQRRFRHKEYYRNQVWKVLIDRFFSKYIPENSAILDLGAGYCEFINNVTATHKLAMDLNPEIKKRVMNNIELFHQDCSDHWNIQPESLDVVFTSNFFEHLPNKESLNRTVIEAFKSLKKEGIIICMGPNIKYLNGLYWDFWDHHIPLTDKSLVEILELNGFQIIVKIPKFLPYTMSETKSSPIWLIRVYLKCKIFWPILGKQFLIIGKKRSNI